MTSSTGGGTGRWPFEPVEGGAPTAPMTPMTPVTPTPSAPTAGAPTRRSVASAQAWSPQSPQAAFSAPTASGATAGTGATAQPGQDDGAPPASRRAARDGGGGRRRPPVWLLVVIGLVVIGGIVAAVLLLNGGEQEPEVLPAETVTLAPPTPTVDAIEREPGTPFLEALPSEVRQFALAELAEDTDLLLAGALESYRLTYTDGGTATLTLLAGQWRDAAGPQARLDAVLAEVGEVPEGTLDVEPDPPSTAAPEGEDADDATDAPAPELPDAVQGPVLVDGSEVGRFVFVPREDGTGTIWWTNTTVFLQLDGPWAELRDVFAAFPL